MFSPSPQRVENQHRAKYTVGEQFLNLFVAHVSIAE